MGVRISWLMLATNSLLAWLAASASRVRCASAACAASARASAWRRRRWVRNRPGTVISTSSAYMLPASAASPRQRAYMASTLRPTPMTMGLSICSADGCSVCWASSALTPEKITVPLSKVVGWPLVRWRTNSEPGRAKSMPSHCSLCGALRNNMPSPCTSVTHISGVARTDSST